MSLPPSKKSPPPQKQQHQQDHEVDYTKNFIIDKSFPVYHIVDSPKQIIDTNQITVKKVPMYVNSIVSWTHLNLRIKPRKFTDTYDTDTDLRIAVLEGDGAFYLRYRGQIASEMVEPGHIFIIPAGTSYHVINNSKESDFVFTIDANTLLEME